MQEVKEQEESTHNNNNQQPNQYLQLVRTAAAVRQLPALLTSYRGIFTIYFTQVMGVCELLRALFSREASDVERTGCWNYYWLPHFPELQQQQSFRWLSALCVRVAVKFLFFRSKQSKYRHLLCTK